MRINTKELFPIAPVIGSVQVSAANTNRDGTGTMLELIRGAANGTPITSLSGKAAVTTTAGMLRFFYDDGVSIRLRWELIVTAITVGAAVEAWEDSITLTDFILPQNHRILVSTHNAEAINVFANGLTYVAEVVP